MQQSEVNVRLGIELEQAQSKLKDAVNRAMYGINNNFSAGKMEGYYRSAVIAKENVEFYELIIRKREND